MPAVFRNTDPISCGDQGANGDSTVQAGNLPIVIKQDISAGIHAPGSDAMIASPDVFKLDTSGNGDLNYGVVRVGDMYNNHPGTPAHPGRTASLGAPTVFVNSGGGAGAIVDHSPPFVYKGQVNLSAPPVPPGMKNPNDMPVEYKQANPHISPADQHFFETDDEESAAPLPVGVELLPVTPQEVDTTIPPTNEAPAYTCDDVESLPDTFSWSDVSGNFDSWARTFQLSEHYTVYDLSVGPAVSTYRFSGSSTQANGMSQKEILRNMCYLANIVLEPLKALYGDFIITSAWRSATNNSQHNKGQAVDIQFLNFHGTGQTRQQYFNRAKEIRDHVNYDQLILEWFGKNPWIHISCNPSSHRNQVLTQVANNIYQPGLIRLG